MEGFLLVPRERNSILERSLWKTRFVTLTPQPPPSRPSSSARLNPPLRQMKFGSRNASLVSVDQMETDSMFLSVYKQKADREPSSSYPLSSIVSCTVQDYAYRKTGSSQATLLVSVQIGDSKGLRARRLSQSNHNSRASLSTLLFRSVPGAAHSIVDWQSKLQEHLAPHITATRIESIFSLSENASRPSTPAPQAALPPVSTTNHPGPALSIHTSYTDTSSPNTSPHNPKQTFEGSSYSPVSSDGPRTPSPFPPPSPMTPLFPPRETILDRAFKMNCIPGASPSVADDTQNSIARFEALMENVEKRRMMERQPTATADDGKGDADAIPASAQRALEYISTGKKSAPRPNAKTRHSRPVSLALPSNISIRSSLMDGHAERRRSSVSISTTTSALTNKRLSLADFGRLSSSSSLILARTATTSSRSSGISGISDASFHCVGDVDGLWGPNPSWAGPAGLTTYSSGGGMIGI